MLAGKRAAMPPRRAAVKSAGSAMRPFLSPDGSAETQSPAHRLGRQRKTSARPARQHGVRRGSGQQGRQRRAALGADQRGRAIRYPATGVSAVTASSAAANGTSSGRTASCGTISVDHLSASTQWF